ncbi:hypothetical protein ON010_g3083 [Phytophthora cinnamomi]|nr:hypothetical protein ON010_g3083 [Phytophthora cinnamomi]
MFFTNIIFFLIKTQWAGRVARTLRRVPVPRAGEADGLAQVGQRAGVRAADLGGPAAAGALVRPLAGQDDPGRGLPRHRSLRSLLQQIYSQDAAAVAECDGAALLGQVEHVSAHAGGTTSDAGAFC